MSETTAKPEIVYVRGNNGGGGGGGWLAFLAVLALLVAGIVAALNAGMLVVEPRTTFKAEPTAPALSGVAVPLDLRATVLALAARPAQSVRLVPTAQSVATSKPTSKPTLWPTETPFCGGGWYTVGGDGRIWCESGVRAGGTPTPDREATVQAWLAGPVSTEAPWPTATPVPTEEVQAFKASFGEQSGCSPFLGYVGPKKKECADYFATATAMAAED